MPTARPISGPPNVDIVAGQRVLKLWLITDVGVHVPELHEWAAANPKYADRVTWSEFDTTILGIAPGLVYDGSSEPWFAALFLGPRERRERAGAHHDDLYRIGAPRAPSDLVWRIIAESGELHLDPVRGAIGWGVLRAVGWVAYRRRARERRAQRP